MKHLIYKYEILSQNLVDCAIAALAVLVFDDKRLVSDNPYTMDELREQVKFYKFDMAEQATEFNRRPQRSSLEWWKNNVDPKVQKWILAPTKTDISIENIPTIFQQVIDENLERDSFVISRGASFGVQITKNICHQFSKPLPWKFWQENCSRSLLNGVLWQVEDTRNDFMPNDVENYRRNNPIDECAIDVMRLQVTQRIIAGLD